jgi:hypothetical protein
MSAIFLGASFKFGSTDAALAWLQGQPVILSERVVNLGESTPDQPIHCSIRVFNRSRTKLTIIGGYSPQCRVYPPDLPAEIPPGCYYDLRLDVYPRPIRGMFNESIELYTAPGAVASRRVDFVGIVK